MTKECYVKGSADYGCDCPLSQWPKGLMQAIISLSLQMLLLREKQSQLFKHQRLLLFFPWIGFTCKFKMFPNLYSVITDVYTTFSLNSSQRCAGELRTRAHVWLQRNVTISFVIWQNIFFTSIFFGSVSGEKPSHVPAVKWSLTHVSWSPSPSNRRRTVAWPEAVVLLSHIANEANKTALFDVATVLAQKSGRKTVSAQWH